MKKIVSIILAVMMAALLCAGALAEEFPQPEGGRKFESNWGIGGGIVQIYYEEEGYRVYIHIFDNESRGTEWQYNCLYDEAKDALISLSSSKAEYVLDPETFDRVFSDPEYDDFDSEGQETVFTIDENGMLIWEDGHGRDGADLEFMNIGRFEGVWRNEAEEVWMEIEWNGLDQEEFNYTVFIRRGAGDTYVEFNLTGLYNPDTGRLEAEGPATVWTKNAQGGFDPSEDGELYDAFLSLTADGKLLYETANGIELEYDELAVING